MALSGSEFTQRLAAILAADAAGYSRLMAADESATVAALDDARGVFRTQIESHHGRVIDMAGDSVLAVFETATGAVNTAVAVQTELAARASGVPEQRRMLFRIGVHLGDVIEKPDGTVYGDGVNIAARLQSIGQPGGVAISQSVHVTVCDRIAVTFVDMGEHEVKNIARPVRAFFISVGGSSPMPQGTATQAARAPTAGVRADSGKPSIAILPFDNMSGDPEQRYFSDGITEDIITELSRLQSLFVIARNSSFQYRDKAVDVRQVGSGLGVRYVVEGSVRKLGNRLRITAQLIEAPTGNHLWSERYDRGIDELFEVQDEVTRTIVATLIGRVEDAEIKGSVRRHPDNLAAYDSLLRGIEHLRAYGDEENRRARELFEQAISLDPLFALAHAYFSLALLLEHGFDHASDAVKDRAIDSARLAVRLDPRESRAHQFLGQAYLLRGDFDLAISHFERASVLNPNDAHAMAHRGYALAIVGRAEEGIEVIRRAMLLNPLHPDWLWDHLAVAQYTAGYYEDALNSIQKSPARDNFEWVARMAAFYAQLGQLDKARERAAEVLRLKPDFHLSLATLHHKKAADSERWLDGMRKAGLPE